MCIVPPRTNPVPSVRRNHVTCFRARQSVSVQSFPSRRSLSTIFATDISLSVIAVWHALARVLLLAPPLRVSLPENHHCCLRSVFASGSFVVGASGGGGGSGDPSSAPRWRAPDYLSCRLRHGNTEMVPACPSSCTGQLQLRCA